MKRLEWYLEFKSTHIFTYQPLIQKQVKNDLSHCEAKYREIFEVCHIVRPQRQTAAISTTIFVIL